jgi:hypothetical protein
MVPAVSHLSQQIRHKILQFDEGTALMMAHSNDRSCILQLSALSAFAWFALAYHGFRAGNGAIGPISERWLPIQDGSERVMTVLHRRPRQ